MTVMRARFTERAAPCGQLTAGEHFEARDDQGMSSDETLFDCGCKISREEYHDGSVEHTVIRHDGKLLDHETIGEHGA